ncbi:hypothetical protein AVEN_261362-1, partial [Araneus ventricosus]
MWRPRLLIRQLLIYVLVVPRRKPCCVSIRENRGKTIPAGFHVETPLTYPAASHLRTRGAPQEAVL